MKRFYSVRNADVYSSIIATLDFNPLNTYYKQIKKYYRLCLLEEHKWEWKIIN
jgi:hypothetical protein